MSGGIVRLLGLVLLIGLGAAVYTLFPRLEPVEEEARAPEGERVRVEVENAGGVSDMARLATLRLRALGFDVVRYGNAGRSDEDTTRIYDRVGRPEWALAVRQALGAGVVETAKDSTLLVDVTVLVGRDWSAGGDDRPPGGPPEPDSVDEEVQRFEPAGVE